MASHIREVDKIVTHYWLIFEKYENGTKCPLPHKYSMWTPVDSREENVFL